MLGKMDFARFFRCFVASPTFLSIEKMFRIVFKTCLDTQ